MVVDDEAQGKAQMVPKPRFLDQLETFLKKELRSLGVNEVEPSELRLQVSHKSGQCFVFNPISDELFSNLEFLLKSENVHNLPMLGYMVVLFK